jgi:hypothetical protein
MGYEFVDVPIEKVVRGDTFEENFTIGEGFAVTPDMSIKAEVREYDDSSLPILVFSTADGSIVIDGQDVILKKSALDMNIPVLEYVYDVQFTSITGVVTTLFGGKFEMKKDVTR